MKAMVCLVLRWDDGGRNPVLINLIGDEINGKIEPMELSRLDDITTNYKEGAEVRLDPKYKSTIDTALDLYNNKYNDPTKKKTIGKITLVYTTDNGLYSSLKLLYKNDSNKKNVAMVYNGIKRFFASDEATPEVVISFINKFNYLFGLNYPLTEVYSRDMATPLAFYAKKIYPLVKKMKSRELNDEEKNESKTDAIKIIKERIKSNLTTDVGYGDLRLIDSYLRREYNYHSTPKLIPPKIIKTSQGTIRETSVLPNNYDEIFLNKGVVFENEVKFIETETGQMEFIVEKSTSIFGNSR
ncbi:MAG: hypothetical protein RSB99_03260 [Bacilli bacterium]